MRKVIIIFIALVLLFGYVFTENTSKMLNIVSNALAESQYETLQPGSKGQAVLDARMRLYELGYFSKVPTQTEYTKNMMDYVKRFEKDYGLKQDGILSPEDQEVLFGKPAEERQEGSSESQYETLQPGSKGQAVLDARMRLYELGYFSKVPTQTEYTKNMMDYVKKFEKDYGLKQDGILSPEDQEVLFGNTKDEGAASEVGSKYSTPQPSSNSQADLVAKDEEAASEAESKYSTPQPDSNSQSDLDAQEKRNEKVTLSSFSGQWGGGLYRTSSNSGTFLYMNSSGKMTGIQISESYGCIKMVVSMLDGNKPSQIYIDKFFNSYLAAAGSSASILQWSDYTSDPIEKIKDRTRGVVGYVFPVTINGHVFTFDYSKGTYLGYPTNNYFMRATQLEQPVYFFSDDDKYRFTGQEVSRSADSTKSGTITAIHSMGTELVLPTWNGSIPVTTVKIEDKNSNYDENITSIVLGDNLEKIDFSSLRAMFPNLQEYKVSNSNRTFASIDGCLYDKVNRVLIACPPQVTEIVIPEGITAIAEGACSNLPNLTSVSIPSTCLKIGDSAFSNCKKLKTVKISAGSILNEISDSAFSGCSSLTSIDLPSNLQTIGRSAFSGCSSLTSIDLPSNLQTIGNSAFSNTPISAVTLPEGITSIGNDAFSACPITEVKLPSSVISIDAGTFPETCLLTVAEDNKTYFEQDHVVFSYDGTLLFYPGDVLNNETYSVPDFVTAIACSIRNVQQITIPSSVKKIDSQFIDGTWHVSAGSYAESYAIQHNKTYKSTVVESTDLSWLLSPTKEPSTTSSSVAVSLVTAKPTTIPSSTPIPTSAPTATVTASPLPTPAPTPTSMPPSAQEAFSVLLEGNGTEIRDVDISLAPLSRFVFTCLDADAKYTITVNGEENKYLSEIGYFENATEITRILIQSREPWSIDMSPIGFSNSPFMVGQGNYISDRFTIDSPSIVSVTFDFSAGGGYYMNVYCSLFLYKIYTDGSIKKETLLSSVGLWEGESATVDAIVNLDADVESCFWGVQCNSNVKWSIGTTNETNIASLTHPEEDSIPSATSVPASTPAPTSKDSSSLIQGDSLAFLEAMALGISNRQNALNGNESSMSREEVLAYRKQMVEYELNEIEKYAFHVFEDKEFDELAHMYINACKTQLYAAENGENQSLYNTLWNSGLHCRVVVIQILYEKYNLPITEEQAAYYRAQMPITIQLN